MNCFRKYELDCKVPQFCQTERVRQIKIFCRKVPGNYFGKYKFDCKKSGLP